MLILGQDPYHGPGQAHGLSFSVRDGVRVPPSLRNVFKELAADLGVARRPPATSPAGPRQGVLLLNAVLTVRAGAAGSHAGKGWEAFTDATIRALNAHDDRVVFLLWGGYARKKAALITNPAHVVLEAGHPSPLNPKGFHGTRPFSAANKALADAGREPIDWDPRGLPTGPVRVQTCSSRPRHRDARLHGGGRRGHRPRHERLAERRTVEPARTVTARAADPGDPRRGGHARATWPRSSPGSGPGPFTGLRVGLVTAASMGQALGIPTYGVCSLDAFGLAAGPGPRAGRHRRPPPGGLLGDLRGRRALDRPGGGQAGRRRGDRRPGGRRGRACTARCSALPVDDRVLFPPGAALVALAADRVRAKAARRAR